MSRPFVDGYGLPVRLVVRGGDVRPMAKGDVGSEPTFSFPKLAPAQEVGTFPINTSAGQYSGRVRRMNGRLILTVTGPSMPLPLHLIVRDAAEAIRKASVCADAMAAGRAPPEGVFRPDDVELLAKGGLGGEDLR